MNTFFLGIHDLPDAKRLDSLHSFISLARLIERKADICVQDWVLDAGTYGVYESGKPALCPWIHALMIQRWSRCGNLLAAVSWDWLCLPHILAKTGLTTHESQRLTVTRYDLLLSYLEMLECDTYLMPVLQGQTPQDYQRHIEMYGNRLAFGQWVGVGSLKGRTTYEVEQILFAIHRLRPDLRLHGFGLTEKLLASELIWDLIHSADSQSWELAARWERRKTGKVDKLSHAREFRRRVTQRRTNQLSIFAKG